MKKMMTIMKMRTIEEVDMETREEAKAIMEAIEARVDMKVMMKITMMKIMTRKMMRIMMMNIMTEAAGEEAAVAVQVVVPAGDLVP